MQFAVGVKGIFTAHGSNMKDIMLNPVLKTLYENNIFERILFIDENRNISLEYEKGKSA